VGISGAPRLFVWAGGKSKLIARYAPILPNVEGRFFVEPFAGGAALFAHLSEDGAIPAILGDVNAEIIGLYRAVRDEPDRLIDSMRDLDREWMSKTRPARKRLYYQWRKRYWSAPESPETTALLYALMRTSFNGIWQTCRESKGKFATPCGLANQKAGIFDAEVVLTWSDRLSQSGLLSACYTQMEVPAGSFVFCDPPYRDSFTSYGVGFGDESQIALLKWCRDLAEKKDCAVWMCNRDAGDDFFEAHAPDATLHRFDITYTAGRRKKTKDGFEAKPATELLLTWNAPPASLPDQMAA